MYSAQQIIIIIAIVIIIIIFCWHVHVGMTMKTIRKWKVLFWKKSEEILEKGNGLKE